MNKKTNFFKLRGERGSALLIVLGFLSFMIISAAAFAIYMRIERQASSNYRHAASARHLLNAALYRAMDEVDSELRATMLPVAGSSSVPAPRKFPNWPGRVRTSAVVNSLDNPGNARVLSLDALSYLPGILLNDVRYYSIPRPQGTPDANRGYLGAKWRPLSMPLMNMDGLNAAGASVIGRYAYTCVNVSDMLNVNHCKAAVRDAAENRVSIGHLFKDDTERKAFDKRFYDPAQPLKSDINYPTLQDFYACMYQNTLSGAFAFSFDSPWHDYLDTGNDLVPFRDAYRHILITDGIVKAEPMAKEKFNITKLPVNNITPVSLLAVPEFVTALNKVFEKTDSATWANYKNNVLGYALADYLDDDQIPVRFDVPSVEIAPMVCELAIADPGPFAVLESRKETRKNAAGNDEEATVIYVNIESPRLPSSIACEVKTAYPFLQTSDRNPVKKFEIVVEGFLKIHSAKDEKYSLQGGGIAPNTAEGFFAKYTGSAFVTADTNIRRDANIRTAPYKVTPVQLDIGLLGGTQFEIWNSLEPTKTKNGFILNDPIVVTFVLSFVGIKSGNAYVDIVPYTLDPAALQSTDPIVHFLEALNMLYFQTDPSLTGLGATMNVGEMLTIPAGGLCFETPDPRFNWKIANWMRSPDTIPLKAVHNTSTENLLGVDGRDADIIMSVSDSGRLQSPGELGFLVRPFLWKPDTTAIDFKNYDLITDPRSDYEAMFRTIRLYDHGAVANSASPTALEVKNLRHDDIYNYLYAANSDDTLQGARVNPLSDIPLVLSAAVERTPLDYWVANEITEIVQNDGTVPAALLTKNFSDALAGSAWQNFTNSWTERLAELKNNTDINTDLNKSIRDEYGNDQYMGWYSSAADRTEIFKPVVTLSQPLCEVDRKMLYSFTLESFSDRQQLFLYIINAEATAASFGEEVASLAGGKAVALVWRDPYPTGFVKGGAAFTAVNGMYDTNNRISPWYQHYLGADNNKYEYYDTNPTALNRQQGYHEQKILFFKYLDN